MADQDKLLEERKEQIIKFLKNDKFLSIFLIISVISLLFSMLVGIGMSWIIGIFTAGTWFVLAICSGISAALIYFNKRDFAFYPLVAWVAWLGYYIRTLSIPGLRDITTGGWALGPDLDPYLFLRWAKYIVAHGSIMANDTMRYSPLGYDVRGEFVFLPYMIAWFHKIASFFGSTSVDQSAAIFPVFFFVITVIAFFFLVRRIFVDDFGKTKSDIIAVIACLFITILPPWLPRSIAGIPEKESAAFFFMFVALYLFIKAWYGKSNLSRYGFALLSGLATAGMSLVWGGSAFLDVTIGVAVFFAFLLGQVDTKKLYIYLIWVFASYLIPSFFSTRYTILNVLTSTISGAIVGVAVLMAIHIFLFKYFEKYTKNNFLSKIPAPLLSVIVVAILIAIVGTFVFGIGFVTQKIGDITQELISPIYTRFGVTVAENHQPFFSEWAGSFGPTIHGVPIFFWLFFIGSVYLFYFMLREVFTKKEKLITTAAYTIFLFSMIFSRYSADSLFNGTNGPSLLFYFLGFMTLTIAFGYYYFKYFERKEESKFNNINFGIVLVFFFFFLALIASRGAIRMTLVLVQPSAIIVAYLIVSSFQKARNTKDSNLKIITWAIALFIIISSIYASIYFYQASVSTAQSYIPTAYNQQWQKAMAWVRDNTPTNAVFGHWWDYGYWLQAIGLRATVLDGGNAIVYWDHLMGRYGLTETNESKALEFLYAHNTTHFLIDSSDIGKYPAFSSIGSDDKYDRYSWISVMSKDPRQTQETKNSTLFIYTGGIALDEDINYNQNGTNIFIPSGSKSGLAGVITERDSSGKLSISPIGVFVYQNNQYRIPFRYAYDSGKLIDFGSGLEAGIYVMPSVDQSATSMDQTGAILYLSKRTVNTQFARLYLYKENNQAFKLVHSEDDFIVAQLKASNLTTSDIVYYQGVRGPIRIWDITYPKNIKLNPDLLLTDYPNPAYGLA